SSTGQALKVLEFDSFGNPIGDSNPSFDLPIGFGGGLADSLTGLVRFGLRDYDPVAGRWTARDPIRFSGGQGNLFAYLSNDPVNLRDPLGLFCLGFSAYVGIGGGAQICIGSGGLSICGEAGFGLGTKAQLDSGGVAKDGSKIGAEISVKCGPAGIGVGASLDDRGCAEFELQGELGFVNFEGDKVGV